MMLDRKSIVNVIMNKVPVKDIRNTCGRFICVHYNTGTSTIRTEATLPGFGTVWFDDRCIANILSLSKSKNRYRIMYGRAEIIQFIMVMPDTEFLFDKSQNGIYYHDMEDRDLVLVVITLKGKTVLQQPKHVQS